MSYQNTPKLKQLPARMNYEVGYAKPPLETRFKKGQSGNPRGRPRGTRNKLPALNEERLKAIVLQEPTVRSKSVMATGTSPSPWCRRSSARWQF
jgi:hypothetical protein